MIIPGFGMISHVISAFSDKPVFGTPTPPTYSISAIGSRTSKIAMLERLFDLHAGPTPLYQYSNSALVSTSNGLNDWAN